MSNRLHVIFLKAFGADGFDQIQRDVAVFQHNHPELEIVDHETSMCSIGNSQEIYQCLVVALWYRLKKRKPRPRVTSGVHRKPARD